MPAHSLWKSKSSNLDEKEWRKEGEKEKMFRTSDKDFDWHQIIHDISYWVFLQHHVDWPEMKCILFLSSEFSPELFSHQTDKKLSAIVIFLFFKMLSKSCHLNQCNPMNQRIIRNSILDWHDYSMVVQLLSVYNEDRVIASKNKVRNHVSRIDNENIEQIGKISTCT